MQGWRRDWHPGEEQLQGVLTTAGETLVALRAKAEGKTEGNKTQSLPSHVSTRARLSNTFISPWKEQQR